MRKSFVAGGIVSAIGFGAFSASLASAVTYPALNPTSTSSASPTVITPNSLFVGDTVTSGYARAYINFSLATLAADPGNIISATLNLSPQTTNGDPAITVNLAAPGLQNAANAGTLLGSMPISGSLGAYESFSSPSLLSALNTWKSNPSSNNGLYLSISSQVSGNRVDFFTGGAETIPQLLLVTEEVAAAAPEPTGLIVLASAAGMLMLRKRRQTA